MLGVALMSVGTAIEETASTIGKVEMKKKVETPFTYATITTMVTIVFFILFACIRLSAQTFTPASIPTLSIRIVLEIIQTSVTVYAIKIADRSTFGFIRTLTIPFLLVIDMISAYAVETTQIIGIGLIVFALFLLFMNHGFSKKGSGLVLISALNAVITTSLYKYDITHFNSPEIEQTIVLVAMLLFFIAISVFRDKKNPFALFRHRACVIQAGLMGVSSVVDSLSFLFAAPSILAATKRTMSVFMSVVLGKTVFKEKHLYLKIAAFSMCAVGFVLLTT